MKPRFVFATANLFLAVLLYLVAVGIRRHVVSQQMIGRHHALPFTLESALHFRRVRMIFENGSLPNYDRAIQYPEGISTWASDTVGAEYALAYLARLFPRAMALEDRVRWLLVLWVGVAVPAVAAWIKYQTGSRAGAWLGALYYAVGIGAVVRSTGQEIMRENFALPFLLAHLAADAAAAKASHTPSRNRYITVSTVTLTLALLTWDLIQFHMLMWTAVFLLHWFRQPVSLDHPHFIRWVVPMGVAMGCACLHPYYRAHGLWSAPVAWMTLGALLVSLAHRLRCSAQSVPSRKEMAVVVLAFFVISWGFSHAYRESYGHFGELLVAKLRHLNQKPSDPSLLTFAQRMLWTPALHSASPSLILNLFPASLGLTLVASVIYIYEQLKRKASPVAPGSAFFYLWGVFPVFVLFVRFHVFLAIAVAAVLGWSVARAQHVRVSVYRSLWMAACVLAVASEAFATIAGAPRWGRSDVAYAQLEALAEWLNTHARGEPVLANFGVSAFVLAYADCPIVLHPKFETRTIRDRVEAYGKELFLGTEISFRDWAERHGARYYIHALGEFSPRRPEYQMRYMVNALQPPPTCPARQFEFDPFSTTRFRWRWGNAKYRVFRVVTRQDEIDAAEYAARAQTALETGDLDAARLLAEHALSLYPGQREAARVIGLVARLRAVGFEPSTEAKAP